MTQEARKLAEYLTSEATALSPYCAGDADEPTIDVVLPAKLRQAATAIETLAARVEELEGVMRQVAEGLVPPDPHGHYLAHREAVRLARSTLKGTR